MKKSVDIKVIFPAGAFGASDKDSPLDSLLRKIALAIDPDDKNWSSKYGANYNNETFSMHRYCWCEEDGCPYCNLEIDFPLFIYKKPIKDGKCLAVWWYKYIGRETKSSMKVSKKTLSVIENDCISSIQKEREDK